MFNLYAIGYFQHKDNTDEFRYDVLRETFALEDKLLGVPPVIHIRGGDIPNLEASRNIGCGILPPEYYRQAIAFISELIKRKFLVITNDVVYAKSILNNDVEFQSASLVDDFRAGVFAAYYVSSSSTLSFWIIRCRERQGLPSVLPKPFSKNHNFSFSYVSTEIDVEY